jgi:hypothetical protein
VDEWENLIRVSAQKKANDILRFIAIERNSTICFNQTGVGYYALNNSIL